jgi:hypothetical protein
MRTFIFFNSSEKAVLDYSQLVETSQDTLRLSLDGTKTFVSYNSETMPDTILALTSYIGPLTYEETLTLLQTAEWLPPAPTI